MQCPPCDAFFSAVQQTDKNYRLQLIGRHLKSATHLKHTRGGENGHDLILTKSEEEYILRLQLSFCAKTNQPLDIFR